MKTLRILTLAVMALGLSLAASAQTYSGANGCTTWGQYGNQRTITSCSTSMMNVTVYPAPEALPAHYVMNPGQVIVFGSVNDRAWDYTCTNGGWAKLKSNPDVEPPFATANDDAVCKIN